MHVCVCTCTCMYMYMIVVIIAEGAMGNISTVYILMSSGCTIWFFASIHMHPPPLYLSLSLSLSFSLSLSLSLSLSPSTPRYTKPKGQLPDYTSPIVLMNGKSSVEDFCNNLHKGIIKEFKQLV